MVKTKNSSPTQPTSPSDQLDLRPGQSIELLKALHILTREGKLNQDSRRKLKQVKHLFQFIEKPLMEMLTQRLAHGNTAPITLADHGAGKSYLGFMIHDLFFKPQQLVHGRSVGQVIGIETRPELVAASQQLAKQLGFAEGMQFVNASVSQAATDESLPEQIDMVTALHACDTATDDAIAFGLAKHAKFMALVPCCQAEVAACLRQDKALQLARTPLAELWRHPLHTREMGSQITNVMRCLYLELQGYQVTVTELVGWEHSMKNELILAHHTGQKKHSAGERLQALLTQLGLQAWGEMRFPASLF
ncbi:Methyltransferase domain containing protein [Burkholderiaceae bacterium]